MAIQTNNNYTVAGLYELIFVKNIKHVFTGLIIAVVCATLFFTHYVYVGWREKSAQRDFGPLLIQYNMMSREKDPQWSPLLEEFEKNYKKHSRSALLPYYMEFKAHILLQQDKKEEALVCLDRILADVQLSSLSPLLQMERALILLDSADSAMRNEGEENLKKLAFDKNNQFNDSALFYLGRYYWSANKVEQAQNTWQQLVDEQRDEKLSPSPWLEQAKEYLKVKIV